MNKQIIIRMAISAIFIAFSLRVLIPILFDFFKNKLSGNQQNDIDWMIKKKTDQLKLQHGIISSTKESRSHQDQPDLAREVKLLITKDYAYSANQAKLNNFITLSTNRKYLNFLPEKYKNTLPHQNNFLAQAFILSLIVEEIIKKKFTISEILAKKISTSLYIFTMGIQIKVLLHMKSNSRTEEEVFGDNYILHNFSENDISNALESIMQKEAALWAQSTSLLFEELALFFHYATIVQPIPTLANKSDVKTARHIIGCNENDSIDVIKRKYKKIALLQHPDKITAQKLPPKLEKKGIDNFNRIQEAYEVLCLELPSQA